MVTAPTAGDDVRTQTRGRVKSAGGINKVHLHGQKTDVRRGRKNVRRLARAVTYLVLQRERRGRPQHHGRRIVATADKVRMLEPTGIAHRDLDPLAGDAGPVSFV